MTATRALDRVFMHEHYQVPDLYGASYRVSRWDRFGIPKTLPKYYTIDDPQQLAPVGGHHLVGQGARQGGRSGGGQGAGEGLSARRAHDEG